MSEPIPTPRTDALVVRLRKEGYNFDRNGDVLLGTLAHELEQALTSALQREGRLRDELKNLKIASDYLAGHIEAVSDLSGETPQSRAWKRLIDPVRSVVPAGFALECTDEELGEALKPKEAAKP